MALISLSPPLDFIKIGWNKLRPHLKCCSQKALLSKYAADNGFSNPIFSIYNSVFGVTFDRPNFNRMIVEIEAGNVGTVIVKDYCAIIGLNQKDLENQGILA